MKKILLLVPILLTTLFSCSSDNNNEENVVENIIPATNLKMDIELSTNNTFEVDKPIYFTVNSNENINLIGTSIDNWNTSSNLLGSLDKSHNVVQRAFQEIGQKTIYVMIRNEKDEIVKKSFQVEIIKGGAVKIKSIKVVSFKNINGSWDPEYPDNDVNRLADLKFILKKRFITTSFYGKLESSTQNWYYSEELLENQGNLIWNLNSKSLYIDPNSRFSFGLVDIDGNNSGQSLVDEYVLPEFSFKTYINDKPNTVTFKKDELEIHIELEW